MASARCATVACAAVVYHPEPMPAPRAFSTPRDRLQRLVDYAVRARRYWWIVAAFVVMGGALSAAFAMTRPTSYE